MPAALITPSDNEIPNPGQYCLIFRLYNQNIYEAIFSTYLGNSSKHNRKRCRQQTPLHYIQLSQSVLLQEQKATINDNDIRYTLQMHWPGGSASGFWVRPIVNDVTFLSMHYHWRYQSFWMGLNDTLRSFGLGTAQTWVAVSGHLSPSSAWYSWSALAVEW